jgi:hypothetical protein
MRRIIILAAFICTARLCADNGVHDPEFDKVPFSTWLSRPGEGKWTWKTRVLPVTLSPHQRLLAQIQIELDGSDAARRRGVGKLVFYYQFTDAKGRTWQDHATVDLSNVPKHPNAITVTESAFVLPGDYSLSFAVSDTASGGHSAKQDRLHVEPIHADPLPLLWQELPAVEFVAAADSPDCWYLPKQQGRLNLPVHPRRPVRIELIVNRASRLWAGPDSDLSFLLPYLRVLSQIKGRNARINVSIVDVERRRELFRQSAVEMLDWPAMRPSFEKVASQIVDVRDLAVRESRAAFLQNRVVLRLTSLAGPELPIIIVMSGAVYPEEMHQSLRIAMPAARIIYIRLRGKTLDQLAQVLDVTELFDVITPDDFRNAIQKIVADIDEL